MDSDTACHIPVLGNHCVTELGFKATTKLLTYPSLLCERTESHRISNSPAIRLKDVPGLSWIRLKNTYLEGTTTIVYPFIYPEYALKHVSRRDHHYSAPVYPEYIFTRCIWKGSPLQCTHNDTVKSYIYCNPILTVYERLYHIIGTITVLYRICHALSLYSFRSIRYKLVYTHFGVSVNTLVYTHFGVSVNTLVYTHFGVLSSISWIHSQA